MKMFQPDMPNLSAMKPSQPRVQRLPSDTDPTVLEAARRTRRAAAGRKGRLSTIMTDNTRETVGSSGQALGA